MLSPERIDRLRQDLLEEQERLRQDLNHLEADQSSQDTNVGVGNHPAEDALLTETQEEMVSLRHQDQAVLNEVDDALGRMDRGTYGTCERCGRAIDFARLKAMPYARYCMDCQRLLEL